MLKIKKELAEHKAVLVMLESGSFNESAADAVKELAAANTVCYITLNKTFPAIREMFEKKKINMNNIVFVDGISKTMKANTPSQTNGCYFVSSPGALTELSMMASKFLRHGFDYLVLDSLTSILVYQSQAPVARFVSNLVSQMASSETRAVFFATRGQMEKQVAETEMFVGKVLRPDAAGRKRR